MSEATTAAEDALRDAIRANPEDPAPRFNLGALLAKAGRYDEALGVIEKVMRLAPDRAEPFVVAGYLSNQLGDPGRAIELYRRALALDPRDAAVHFNLALSLQQLGRYEQALGEMREVLRLDPSRADACASVAYLWNQLGNPAQAVESYQRALKLDPRDAAAHFNLGLSLQQLGRYEEALAEMREVTRLDPDRAEAFMIAGDLESQLEDPDQAIAFCRRAIELEPDLAEAYCHLGLIQQSLGQQAEAIDSFRKGVELDPASNVSHVNLLYALNFLSGPTAEEIFAEHRAWAERHADPLTAQSKPCDNDPSPDRRLRIGYVSAHFRGHAVNSFVEPILAAHDPATFEVFCYSNLAPWRADETTARLRSYAVDWREIAHLDDEQASEMVRADRIDILVDLAGHIDGNRLLLFARKPAPVQVTYIGYQNTTGMAAMDYRLTDEWSDPPDVTDRFYAAQLVRLPHAFFCFRPPDDAPPTTPLPALSAGHLTFGSFNNFAKVTPSVLETWARLLAAVPDSRLLLLAPRSESLRARVQEAFGRQGVDVGRVELVPRRPHAEYLRLIERADVALDAFPFNGHTTTCDALWMGVPVVMLAGDSYASRFGGSALVNLGLTDFIAGSVEQYLEIAANLATDVEKLARLRAELRSRMAGSVLVDGQGFTRRLESAYRQMWHSWCSRSAST